MCSNTYFPAERFRNYLAYGNSGKSRKNNESMIKALRKKLCDLVTRKLDSTKALNLFWLHK